MSGGAPILPSHMREGRCPGGAVTGVGSLPFRDALQAIDFVRRRSPEIPFWPQLPKRASAETSLLQFLGPAVPYLESQDPTRLAVRPGLTTCLLDALASADGAIDGEHAACFSPFLAALTEGVFPRACLVKAQVTGPVSLGMCTIDGLRPLVHDPGALRILTDYVARQAVWQVRQLAAAGLPILIFVDEPCLALAPSLPGGAGRAIQAVATVLNRIRESGARAGLHCCADVPPALLCHAGPDVISFDANSHLERFLDSDAIRAFVARDGWLAAGMVPTTRVVARESAGSLFARWVLAASRCNDTPRLARQTIVTATCGLGLVPPGAAGASFRAAGRLGDRLRRVADH